MITTEELQRAQAEISEEDLGGGCWRVQAALEPEPVGVQQWGVLEAFLLWSFFSFLLILPLKASATTGAFHFFNQAQSA